MPETVGEDLAGVEVPLRVAQQVVARAITAVATPDTDNVYNGSVVTRP
ncbi:hypothetical protein ACIBQ5_34330 [Streptomyces massasporeus]